MKLRELVANMGDKVAKETYGKSIPFFVYEPKVPQALKNACEEVETEENN